MSILKTTAHFLLEAGKNIISPITTIVAGLTGTNFLGARDTFLGGFTLDPLSTLQPVEFAKTKTTTTTLSNKVIISVQDNPAKNLIARKDQVSKKAESKTTETKTTPLDIINSAKDLVENSLKLQQQTTIPQEKNSDITIIEEENLDDLTPVKGKNINKNKSPKEITLFQEEIVDLPPIVRNLPVNHRERQPTFTKETSNESSTNIVIDTANKVVDVQKKALNKFAKGVGNTINKGLKSDTGQFFQGVAEKSPIGQAIKFVNSPPKLNPDNPAVEFADGVKRFVGNTTKGVFDIVQQGVEELSSGKSIAELNGQKDLSPSITNSKPLPKFLP